MSVSNSKKINEALGKIEELKKILEEIRESVDVDHQEPNVSEPAFVKKLVAYVKANTPCTEKQIVKAFRLSERGKLWHTLKPLTNMGVLAHNYTKQRDQPYYFVRDLTEDDLSYFTKSTGKEE